MDALLRNAIEKVARAQVLAHDPSSTPTTTLAEAVDVAEARFRAPQRAEGPIHELSPTSVVVAPTAASAGVNVVPATIEADILEEGVATLRRSSQTPALGRMLTLFSGRGPRRSAASCPTNLEDARGAALGAEALAVGEAGCGPGAISCRTFGWVLQPLGHR